MVTRFALGTVVIALAVVARPDAATPPEITTTVTLGNPPALNVTATYSDPAALFPVLDDTLVFPLYLEIRNVSTSDQTLDLPNLELRLGDARGTPVTLSPINAGDAQDRLTRDVKLHPAVRNILGQAGNGPWNRNTYDRVFQRQQLKPGQTGKGYVFFLKPKAFQFNGMMSLGTKSHPSELLTTGPVLVTRSGGPTFVQWACGLLTSSVPSMKTWCNSMTGAPFDRSYALLFGVTIYDDKAKLPWLPGAALDLKRMGDFLSRQNFDQVTIIKDNKVTPSALRDVQSHFSGKLGARDRLLVYYVGHGLLSTNGGADLVLSDNTHVPMTQFMSWIRQVKVKHLLVLLDACYSGAALAGTMGDIPPDANALTSDKIMRLTSRGSRFVITAGSNDERALEHSKWWEGGLFTYAVLTALQPKSTKPTLVTTYEMFSKVRDVMYDQERAHGVALQTPLIQDLGYSSDGRTPAPASQGEFVFVRGK